MFGSDWPVCRLRCEYADWAAAVRRLIGELSTDEQRAIMGDNAMRAYGLGG